MKTGVSTASLFMRADNEEALPILNDLGVPCAEVFLTSFSEYDDAFARLVASRKGQVEIDSVHILNSQIEPQLFSRHPRVKRDTYEWLGRAMSAAKVLGARYYTFHGTARYKKSSRYPENDDLQYIGGCIREAFDFCHHYGITLCLENVEWSTYNRPGVFAAVQSACPSLKGVLDIKQARISGFDYTDYLAEMGDALAYVHVSDFYTNGKMCLPGRGVFDFDTFIKRLKDRGFQGNLFVEAYKDDYTDVTELKTACDYLNELLDKNCCLG